MHSGGCNRSRKHIYENEVQQGAIPQTCRGTARICNAAGRVLRAPSGRHESISASSSVESDAIGADDVQQGFHHLRIELFARLLAEVREHGGA